MCTDGSDDEKNTLRDNLAPVTVHFFDEDLGKKETSLPPCLNVA